MKTNKNRNMKKLIFLVVLAFGLVMQLQAQNINTDFVVLDPNCQDFTQLQAQYQGQTNALVIAPSQVMAPDQIAAALVGKSVVDLHIFVWSKPGSTVFINIGLIPENVDEYATPLGTWASHVTGNVVIHGTDVFTTARGLEFKTKLQQLTGLNFIVQ
jgi:hypothetical protein